MATDQEKEVNGKGKDPSTRQAYRKPETAASLLDELSEPEQDQEYQAEIQDQEKLDAPRKVEEVPLVPVRRVNLVRN